MSLQKIKEFMMIVALTFTQVVVVFVLFVVFLALAFDGIYQGVADIIGRGFLK